MSEVRACADCGRLQSYPAPVCRGCGGGRIEACAPPFQAELYSHTTVWRAPNPVLQAETPYTAVLVRGTAGGLLLLRWRGGGLPAIGAPVQVRNEDAMLVAGQTPESAS